MRGDKAMIEPKEWSEFRNSGLLWVVNRTLHLFGWAIVIETAENSEDVISVYPARVGFRGFAQEIEDKGFKQLTTYMKNNAKQLLKEVEK